MHNEFAKWEMKTRLFSRRKTLAGNCCSISQCRGKGKHEVMEDPRTGVSLVRIEFLVKPEVGDKIMEYHSDPGFRRRAVAACMETVQVPASDPF